MDVITYYWSGIFNLIKDSSAQPYKGFCEQFIIGSLGTKNINDMSMYILCIIETN